jgi:hypothetical protein
LILSSDPEQVGKYFQVNYYKTPDDVLLASFKTQKGATLVPNRDGMMTAINVWSHRNILKRRLLVVDITLQEVLK